MSNSHTTVALAGNPNVGKSTVFNTLTGLKQHTGNWTGKTVECAYGNYTYRDKNFKIVDLPGTYSLYASSLEEEITRDYLYSKEAEVTVVVTDATCLERNLNLVLQCLEITDNVIVCVNLIDEAEKKGIHIDIEKLSELLNVPVIQTAARSQKGMNELCEAIYLQSEKAPSDKEYEQSDINTIWEKAHDIYSKCVFSSSDSNKRDRKIDKLLTSKATGIPVMLLLFGLIFYITIVGANYPSQLLSELFNQIGIWLENAMRGAPQVLSDILLKGMYKTLTWVIAVMLPPMAIFFPLFTLLEDSGYLPRIAFNLDKFFKKANAHGKQSLTMCMGFGCNACGVTGCRIIDSPRERLIAIVTNNLVPCNGRFPTLISIITMFFVGSNIGLLSSVTSTLLLVFAIVLSVVMTLLVSKLLSKTILKGIPSSFALELPPYRSPQIGKVIVRSIFDRTLFVLGRAVAVAAPAGIIIWLLANIKIGNTALLSQCAIFLDPFAKAIGLDGYILFAFILGFPANEIVMPIVIMSYLATGELTEFSSLFELKQLLIANGWTFVTALCTMIFSLFHFPCATTCLTIKKETGSLKYTLLSIVLPTILGIICCFIVATFSSLFI
ncbi:MAG: ferrous iron transporter B [Ruminococcaceae bacterium]|nr:ferrous iron transporter B [Oscillospiraceae bacterium]